MSGPIHPDKAQLRLLFIKLKHIGDALIMTPMLTAVRKKYPESEIHVVVRDNTEGILAGCPAIDRLHTAAAPKNERQSGSWWRDLRLIARLRRVGFDYAFELGDGDRGRLMAWLSGARELHGNDPSSTISQWWRSRFTLLPNENRKHRHQVDKDYTIVRLQLKLPTEIPPLCFTQTAAGPWPDQIPFLLFHPTTRWQRKRWPTDRWIKLGRELARNHDILVSCGPSTDETAEAQAIADGIGERASSTEGRLSWPQLAGALRAAKLFIGVDTAAMHLAAACQCPTVAIFGPSRDWAWHPWMVPHQIVSPAPKFRPDKRTPDPDQILSNIILQVQVSEVLQACQTMLAHDHDLSNNCHFAQDVDTSASRSPTPEE